MGARRLVVVLVHLVGFSWLITQNALPSFALTIGKRGCQTECGNVSIPFPFGIGSTNNCFLDDWFEIVCNTSTFPHTPYLKRSNLQVLNISLKNNHDGSSRNAKADKETRESLNLNGSPFVFSASENMFTAVSCAVRALMSSSSLDEFEISAGCKSKCSKTDQLLDNCSGGVNCCQTTIPSYGIKTFSTTFQPETDKTCKYAFVVDQEWFISKFNNTTFYALRDMDYVPATLEWSLNRYSRHQIYGTNLSALQLTQLLRNNSIRCLGDSSISSVNQTAALSVQGCYCKDGFEGNPYLLDGCQGSSSGLGALFLSSGLGALFLLIVATELEAIQKSIKTVADLQSYEEVEYMRTEITEPWDVSTTIGSNPSTSIDVALSLDEPPLLSK
ncbi:hypothetical protein FEM48_Zijuj04G0157100 [Ziziphus jujuba var. spinosa]|uniref:Uncharacterized protein n=1 Tax=Ziziphus jujuba var. spinosa TaxID=714518 RepID=A0A978VKR0_ZIZJJ|nr:hypothetical protein FEM48_Zijuj04G0157100 [Ziziphus jujuba var. spinosa]